MRFACVAKCCQQTLKSVGSGPVVTLGVKVLAVLLCANPVEVPSSRVLVAMVEVEEAAACEEG